MTSHITSRIEYLLRTDCSIVLLSRSNLTENEVSLAGVYKIRLGEGRGLTFWTNVYCKAHISSVRNSDVAASRDSRGMNPSLTTRTMCKITHLVSATRRQNCALPTGTIGRRKMIDCKNRNGICLIRFRCARVAETIERIRRKK